MWDLEWTFSAEGCSYITCSGVHQGRLLCRIMVEASVWRVASHEPFKEHPELRTSYMLKRLPMRVILSSARTLGIQYCTFYSSREVNFIIWNPNSHIPPVRGFAKQLLSLYENVLSSCFRQREAKVLWTNRIGDTVKNFSFIPNIDLLSLKRKTLGT